jgi:hypothetical protein
MTLSRLAVHSVTTGRHFVVDADRPDSFEFADTSANRAISLAVENVDYLLSLASLAGRWTGVADDGQIIRVTYSLHANSSVLMENWQFRGTDALTLYHLDNETLMATHYCPLCNQPRLDLTEVRGRRFSFSFVSATNLSSRDAEHQHAFEIELIDQTHFWRSETYIADGAVTIEAITYSRD